MGTAELLEDFNFTVEQLNIDRVCQFVHVNDLDCDLLAIVLVLAFEDLTAESLANYFVEVVNIVLNLLELGLAGHWHGPVLVLHAAVILHNSKINDIIGKPTN